MLGLTNRRILKSFCPSAFTSLIIVLTLMVNLSYAQSPVLNEYNLLKMQTSSLNEIETFLKTEKWDINRASENQSNYYFGYNLEYNVTAFIKSNVNQLMVYHYPNKKNILIYQISADAFNAFLNQMNSSKGGGTRKSAENYDSTLFNDSNITTEFRVYKNENSLKKYSIVVSNLIMLPKEINKAADIERDRIKFENEQKERYQRAVTNANNLFEQEKYKEALAQYDIAEKIFPNNAEISEKIASGKKGLSQQIIAQGDNQYSNTNFKAAIELYQEARKIGINSRLIDNKIDDANKKIKEVKIKSLMNEASLLFIAEKFNESLVIYKEVNGMDPKNAFVNNRINEINDINNILATREYKVFKYSEINSSVFNNFKSNLENVFNEAIEKNKVGHINFDYNIQFDKEGNNHSNLINKNTTIKKVDQYLTNFDFKSNLTPSMVGKYNVASKELINVDLNWKTSKVTYRSKQNNIKSKDLSTVSESLFKSYIYGQYYSYGKYTFEVVNKKNNDEEFTDVSLVDYSVPGPESAFLSMVLPGLGTLNVTQGKKGWGRLGLFIVTAAVSVGANIYSDKEYQKYIDSQDSSESDAFYKKADDLHKISLISGGLAATIYIHDIIWVISKGFQNLKKSKNLRNEVNKNAIEIRKQKIKL